MGAKELLMLDEQEKRENDVSIILPEGFEIVGNILTVSKDKALHLATLILIQVELG